MVISNEVLKYYGLTKVERVENEGFVIETQGGASLYLPDDLLGVLFRASDLDSGDFV
jgi:hypothetical protein